MSGSFRSLDAEALVVCIDDGVVDTRRLLLLAQKLCLPEFERLCDVLVDMTPADIAMLLTVARGLQETEAVLN
ncbi:MAG: hypothetical protein AAFX39_14800 [Pseudomonadota bacterium]